MHNDQYHYQVSPKLLELLKKITLEVASLNSQRFSSVILHELELEADAQSSFSSTSIEGNPLPLTEVKKLLKSTPAQLRNTEREVLNYNDALIGLKQQLDSKSFEFNMKLVLETHRRVTNGLLPKHQIGKYRREPVFVNDPVKRKTIYWPPDHQNVAELMQVLIEYVRSNQKQMDPIILGGIFHKQFVIVHPFVDGNGRTVRLLTKSILAQLGLDTFHLFSFENYYNKNVTSYFKNVGVLGNYYDIVTKISFTEWLEYFAEGILDELLRVRKRLHTEGLKITPPNARVSEEQQKILDFIEEHGSIQDKNYARLTSRAKATRALDFKKLLQLGLIKKLGLGPATYYVLAQSKGPAKDPRSE